MGFIKLIKAPVDVEYRRVSHMSFYREFSSNHHKFRFKNDFWLDFVDSISVLVTWHEFYVHCAAGGVWIICHSCQGLIRVQMCVFCAFYSPYMNVIAVYMYVVCIIVVLICNVFYWVWVVFLKLCVLCPCSDRGLLQADICVSGTGRCSPKRRGTGSVSRGERPPQSLWRRWRAAPRKAPPLWSSRSRATVCFSAASTRRPSPATAKPLWVEHQFVCLQDIYKHIWEKKWSYWHQTFEICDPGA